MLRERQFEVINSQQINLHLLCPICGEVFYNPIRAKCGHTFCGTCLVRSIQTKQCCPFGNYKLERNYSYDKDILATKMVGDLEVKCLRCQLWQGNYSQFKQHKKSQCTYISTNNQIHEDAIEIRDNEQEYTMVSLIEDNDTQFPQQIIENNEDQNLVQIHQFQNSFQQQQSQQNLNLNIIQQESNLVNNDVNNDIKSNQLSNQNQLSELNIQIPQQIIENFQGNLTFNQNNDNENQLNHLLISNPSIEINNVVNQDNQDKIKTLIQVNQKIDYNNDTVNQFEGINQQTNDQNNVNVDNQKDNQQNNFELDNNNQNSQNNLQIQQDKGHDQLNNVLIQDQNNNNDFIIQQQSNFAQIPEHNQKEFEDDQFQVQNQSQICKDILENNQKHDVIVQQDSLIKVDSIQNQIQTESSQDQVNQNDQNHQFKQLVEDKCQIIDPDIQIINPVITSLNNKDLKKIKAQQKFKINILKNNVKIAEPMMEIIDDNLFFEFVNHMKKEMVKKLSDIQYYDTLFG